VASWARSTVTGTVEEGGSGQVQFRDVSIRFSLSCTYIVIGYYMIVFSANWSAYAEDRYILQSKSDPFREELGAGSKDPITTPHRA
jgi:hypothetical protein